MNATITIEKKKLVKAWIRSAFMVGIPAPMSAAQMHAFQKLTGEDFSEAVMETMLEGGQDESGHNSK